MAIKTYTLKEIIEKMDSLANFTINRSKINDKYFYVSFESYDKGLWRPYDYVYSRSYLLQTWKQTTDRDINEYINKYTFK